MELTKTSRNRYFSNAYSNFIKYFLSYFIILAVSLIGLFLIVSLQLKNVYSENLTEKRLLHITSLGDQINNELKNLDQIESAILKDAELQSASYPSKGWYQYVVANNIEKYSVGNDFVDSIFFIDKKCDLLYSTGKHFKFENGKYAIYNGKNYVDFSLDEYIELENRQLVRIADLLIYLPAQNSKSDRFVFYTISKQKLNTIFESGLVNDIQSIGFISENQKVLAGINTKKLEPKLFEVEQEPLETKVLENGSLLITPKLQGNFFLVALGAKKGLLTQIYTSLRQTFLLSLLLTVFGIIFILLAMRQTYWPLHKLTHKILSTTSEKKGYLKQLDDAFTNVQNKNDVLTEKIDHYRLSMQKSILDTIVLNDDLNNINKDFNIDNFFIADSDSQFFIVLLKTTQFQTTKLVTNFKKLIDISLPDKNSVASLNQQDGIITFIIRYSGNEPDKEKSLLSLLRDFYDETGTLVSLSDPSDSPLEMPFLYKNAIKASQSWNDTPVVSYNQIDYHDNWDNQFEYPYNKLETLNKTLNTQQFNKVKKSIHDFLLLIESNIEDKLPFPDFFTRCVLLDILSTIVNSMDHFNIKFSSYNKLYFETLYLCQNYTFEEKREEIYQNILELIDIYEKQYHSSTINPTKVKQFMKEHYSSPDFSIFTLADEFDVSTAYMSFLFKQALGTNFSTYLWNIRQDKAIQLLNDTDMTVDNVSSAVGYINVSSFRRKFKQETGKTPSQIRKK